jgi:signal transduction histidine kinase
VVADPAPLIKMRADIPTLALISGCIAILQALAFSGAWALNRSTPGLGRWTVGSLLGGTALLLILCRQGVDSPLLTHWLPTLLVWAGAALLYVGAAEFRGRRALLKWPLLCCVPALAGYLWFGWVAPQTWLRPLFYSTPTVLFLGLTAREWLGEQRAGLRVASCCGGVAAVIYALTYVARAGLIAIHQVDPEPLQGGGAQVMVIVSTLLWLFGWTYTALLLLNQWHHSEKLRFHEAQLTAQKNLVDAERQLALRERELLNERTLRQRDLLLRDLHDGIGGMTANLVLLVSMGRREEEAAERHELMRHIEHLVVACNREVRSLMDVLEQGSVDWGQFLQELREHAEHLTAAHGFQLDWQVSGQLPTSPLRDATARLSLLRCLKEAVSNLARHAHAREATIRVRFFKQGFGITVRDDGIGLQQGKIAASGGRGMPNMRRRCEELGGRMTIRRNSGTMLRFIIPLPVSLHPIAKKPPIRDLAIA